MKCIAKHDLYGHPDMVARLLGGLYIYIYIYENKFIDKINKTYIRSHKMKKY